VSSRNGHRIVSGVFSVVCALSGCASDELEGEVSRADQAVTDSAAMALARSQLIRRDVDGFFGAFDFDAFSIAIANVASPPILRECEITRQEVASGSCEITVCPEAISFPTNISAGTARIRGGLQDFTITPRPDGVYDATFQEGPLFTGGDRLLMSLSGQLKPPIVLPAVRLVEAPLKTASITSPRPAAISRLQPFTSTWTGVSSPATVRFNFESDEKSLITDEIFVSRFQLACHFTGSEGEGTIPAATLAQLPAVVGVYNYRVEIEETRDVASQRLTFGLGVPAANGDFLPVTLE
jgi:hypothetical protein